MSLSYVREHYGVPAKRGMKVQVYSRSGKGWVLRRSGRITSATMHVMIDGDPYHPRDGIVYLGDDDEVLLDTRE